MIESQAAGTISPELYQGIVRMVQGIRGRWGMADQEDVLQDVFLLVLQNLHAINPDKNVFSYLTTIVRHEMFKRHRDQERDRRRIERFSKNEK